MAFQEKKFLDAEGVTHLVKLLDEYPNNQILGSVIDAIEGELAEKADKTDIPTKVSELTNDSGYLTSETDPTVPNWAKAAQKPSYTAAEVGATTEQEVNSMIASAIGDIHSFDLEIVQALPTTDIKTHTIYLVPKTGETNDVYDEYAYINNSWEMIGNTQIDLSGYALKSELPNIPVQDVQVNGASILQNGVANMPIASATSFGAVKVGNATTSDALTNGGTLILNDVLYVIGASKEQIKYGKDKSSLIATSDLHHAVFYGLARAAGDTTTAQSDNETGTYTSEAKAAIQSMLGVSELIAPEENNLVASKAYVIGDIFTANGKLYKATAAIAQDAVIIPTVIGEEVSGANCVETNLANENIKDVQVNRTSILSNGVANIPLAITGISPGVVKPQGDYGTRMIGANNAANQRANSSQTASADGI